MNMKEIFKDIPGFEGYYQVSNLGRVKTLGNGNSTNPFSSIEKVMKTKLNKSGYIHIKLRKDNKNIYTSVHRLVAMTFLENKENKSQVNHKDGNKTNNIVDNLEWVTSQENIIHSVKNGLQPIFKGIDSKCSKQVEQYDLNDNLIKVWGSLREITRETGFNRTGILGCCKERKRYKTAYGFKWRYKK